MLIFIWTDPLLKLYNLYIPPPKKTSCKGRQNTFSISLFGNQHFSCYLHKIFVWTNPLLKFYIHIFPSTKKILFKKVSKKSVLHILGNQHIMLISHKLHMNLSIIKIPNIIKRKGGKEAPGRSHPPSSLFQTKRLAMSGDPVRTPARELCHSPYVGPAQGPRAMSHAPVQKFWGDPHSFAMNPRPPKAKPCSLLTGDSSQ